VEYEKEQAHGLNLSITSQNHYQVDSQLHNNTCQTLDYRKYENAAFLCYLAFLID
jgi:hypothetical protein